MLCIFNPEHDLCLANGNEHYVPPLSALDFARRAASLMQIIYPSATCLSTPELPTLNHHPLTIIPQPSTLNHQPSTILPWGWNAALKCLLLKQGVDPSLLPSDEKLRCWRELQHRSTWLALQPDCSSVTTPEEVGEVLCHHGAVVLKAPWSGSGRGIRWVTRAMSEHDRRWLQKTVREQRCAIVEPRRKVHAEYALEYMVASGELAYLGYSLFQSVSGVYQGNLLLSDDEIAARVHPPQELRERLESWMKVYIIPYYEGPLGVDFLIDEEGLHHLSEINLRHTMGLVAHEYLRHHPEAHGTLWQP